MELAFELAEEALKATEVPIGCVFIYEDNVIAYGRNESNISGDASQHAELIAIRKLEEHCSRCKLDLAEVLRESVLYVTMEPCIMCAAALRFSLPAQPKRIIFSSYNDRFGGCGSVMSVHSDNSFRPVLVCKSDGQSERAIKMLKRFFGQENFKAPEEKRTKRTG